MDYNALNKNQFNYQNYSVVPFRAEDKLKIKEWRNQQMDILRQKNVLTDDDQINYYEDLLG